MADTDEQTVDQQTEIDPKVEQRALQMGWIPKDKFRGDPERWIDAETFVRRGEEFIPLIKAQNRDLEQSVSQMRTQLTETQDLLKASQESVQALLELNTKRTRDDAKASRVQLTQALKAAREENDVEKELEIQDQLGELNETIKAAEKAPETKKEKKKLEPVPIHPDFQAWMNENADWYNKDQRRTRLFTMVAGEMRAAGDARNGRAFLDAVYEEVEATLGPISEERAPVSKVARARDSSSGSTSSRSRKKTFADLSPEEQQACNTDAKRLVGKGRAFETEKAWQDHYVKAIFGDEA